MKLLFDFLPVLMFFAAYKLADIYVATGVAIAVAVAQIIWCLVRREKIKPVQWIALVFILIFGTAIILLQDEFYIKVKWTLFYGLMGALILGATALGRNPLKSVLGSELDLPAVLQTSDATRVLRDGEEVLVDARNGCVYRLDAG